MINHILIFVNVCERLFDELVKEWLKSRYTIVSGTFREVNGRKIRVRKGHPGLLRGGVFRDASLRLGYRYGYFIVLVSICLEFLVSAKVVWIFQMARRRSECVRPKYTVLSYRGS